MNSSKSKPKAGVQEAPEGLERLEESFDKILSGRNAFQRNYLLVKEAKEWDMTLEEYRTLFEIYCEHALKISFIKFRLSTLPRFWKWTGIAEKKLWDYLQLAAGISIPIVIFLGGQNFTNSTNQKQQEIAEEHYRQDLLSKYFDQMTHLITKDNLLDSNKDQSYVPTKSQIPQIIARVRTLSTLYELGENRDSKKLLIKFLSEAKLILIEKSVITLDNVNLQGVDLSGANLQAAQFSNADLSGANLSGANLIFANLQRASRANLQKAHLQYSKLSGANVSGANLSDANISDADLSGANLSGANLSGANIYWANISCD
ncbi:pentapeptide repeat-containing protein, partial [Aetokthonos hydrillicola]|uniref:pentapeptide repeat-containing protein n=1 Tax=Aetokthonos hydrillicola TaxID=1550245 RepID=UPI001ABB3B34